MTHKNPQPNYGVDAPYIIACFSLAAVLFLGMALLSYWYAAHWALSAGVLFLSVYCLANAILMLMSSLYGKKRKADYLISLLNLQGNETVLDVGCGRGLLLIKVAQKLTTGKAVGIDIWQQADQWANSKAHTQQNVEIVGVLDKVELIDADARSLPFQDNSFDSVMSTFVLHNLHTADDRKNAIQQMVRVLKPGGTLIVQDFQFTQEYADAMRKLGMTDIKRSGLQWWLFPPARIVRGEKN